MSVDTVVGASTEMLVPRSPRAIAPPPDLVTAAGDPAAGVTVSAMLETDAAPLVSAGSGKLNVVAVPPERTEGATAIDALESRVSGTTLRSPVAVTCFPEALPTVKA